ncbi:hypothetical protein Tco_1137940, partial [Tanacetum coccineum]
IWNDLEIAALHIDGQSIDVDAPPDIIDVVDEDDDIINEEDPIPHDLADSDDEDLVNLNIDDGVNVWMLHGVMAVTVVVMIVPLHTTYPPIIGVAWATEVRISGLLYRARKPIGGVWVAGERACSIPARETRNLGLKAITDKSGPVPIRFEFGYRESLMPLGEHAAHWANYLRELVRELPLHYPSWRQVPAEQKALGPSLSCCPHMDTNHWHLFFAEPSNSIYKKKKYNGKKVLLGTVHWITDSDGTYGPMERHQTITAFATFSRWQSQSTGEIEMLRLTGSRPQHREWGDDEQGDDEDDDEDGEDEDDS